uniref:Glycosylated lysosomal membrane protein B n=1 Tax=Xenopus laevis TaxID=8355 RepID=GLMPB_XENLA|nr:RecName: Full=Glycosylated lysosomal membrane protein B; AltName: Full=Lysosomal protein NCU-G1-B; Flags: Precursor [Xenopus laevis]
MSCTRGWRLILLGLLCVGLLGTRGQDESRKVSVQYNPGSSDTSVNVVHVRAVGDGNTIHYVWSTLGTPTVLLIYTHSETSQLQVNWTKLLSPAPQGALRVEPEESVSYATALLFTRIFEYQDVNNTANFSGTDEKYFYPPYNLSEFLWENANATVNATSLSANLTGSNTTDPSGSFHNGSVSFRISAYNTSGRDSSPPRLRHTANCTKLEFLVSGVRPRGNNSRFALEMVTIEKEGRRKMKSVLSIDDEYTPTIFEMMQLVAVAPNSSHARGFLQWKSVAYGSPSGSRADLLPCQLYPLQPLNATFTATSIAHAYFGDDLADAYNLEAFNISFGIADGDFYDKHEFLSWSALIGYGDPPRDSFSILVICIMAVALGTPLLLLIIGTVLVTAVRHKVYPNYQPIN